MFPRAMSNVLGNLKDKLSKSDSDADLIVPIIISVGFLTLLFGFGPFLKKIVIPLSIYLFIGFSLSSTLSLSLSNSHCDEI